MVSHACMPSQPFFVSSDGSTDLCGLYFIKQYFKNSAGNIHSVIGDELEVCPFNPSSSPIFLVYLT